MSSEKPLPYERRLRETKAIAQRLDLGSLKRGSFLKLWRSRLTWSLLAVAAAVGIVFGSGLGTTRQSLSRGPLSSHHALFEQRCEACHGTAFRGVLDSACLKCHDAPAHPAKIVDQARLTSPPACAQCHLEHQGDADLRKVSNGNCTGCHGDLSAHASNAKLKALHITEFRTGNHPEFSPSSRADLRPLKLNHAAHMPAQPKLVRNMKLPMQCTDCHVIDRNSPTDEFLPVTFEQNCKSCHTRELEFDVYQVLKGSVPAPHTKDPKTIHDFISATLTRALADDPGLMRRPLGNDLASQPNAQAWLSKSASAAEAYLFGDAATGKEGKCTYCHVLSGWQGNLPAVQKVNVIHGRFVEADSAGEPWFPRAEFNHRAHRAVKCESCHISARTSAKTSDVLIPAIKECLPCHTEKRGRLGDCSECHLYHNKSLEKERERQPSELLLSAP